MSLTVQRVGHEQSPLPDVALLNFGSENYRQSHPYPVVTCRSKDVTWIKGRVSKSYRQLQQHLRVTLPSENPPSTFPASQGVHSSLWEGWDEERAAHILRLQRWQHNPEDWGPGTRWPTDQAFEEAIAFVKELPLVAFRFLDTGIAEDGEINFLWEDENIEIDLGFYGGVRVCSYFARNKVTGERLRGVNFDPSQGLPEELEELFAA